MNSVATQSTASLQTLLSRTLNNVLFFANIHDEIDFGVYSYLTGPGNIANRAARAFLERPGNPIQPQSIAPYLIRSCQDLLQDREVRNEHKEVIAAALEAYNLFMAEPIEAATALAAAAAAASREVAAASAAREVAAVRAAAAAREAAAARAAAAGIEAAVAREAAARVEAAARQQNSKPTFSPSIAQLHAENAARYVPTFFIR